MDRHAARLITRPILLLSILLGATASAQHAQPTGHPHLDRVSHVVIPQARGFALHRGGTEISIESVQAGIRILEQTATTTLDISLRNSASSQAEAVLLLPVPAGAVVSSFVFQGASSEPTASIMSADEARRIYDSIVAQVRDPALLEFAGYNLIRSSVFPVPAQGTQRIRVTYEHILDVDGDRADYILPRSESLDVRVPWNITVDIVAKDPVSMVYSPTHEITTERGPGKRVRVTVDPEASTEPGHFLLSYLRERNGVSASIFAYPDPKVGGGYFLLMAGLPATIADAPQQVRREVTIVIDRSGSMAGKKMDQVRAAALQIVEGLDEGEAFNIIDYATTVSRFAARPVIKSDETIGEVRQYIAGITPSGGTNIHDAVLESLRQPPTDSMLPIVLFLTDGLPTVGNTSEVAIRELVEKGNVHHRRVFTFGVGSDVNAPLLDRLADISRGTTTYVLPDEDVEVKVARVFRRLYGPVLSNLRLATTDAAGQPVVDLVREPIPSQLPDLFEGDQLILLGQYRREQPTTFKLTGDYFGRERTFTFDFDFDSATTRNAFVPRLWASRRIAYLIDEIRQAGAAVAGQPAVVGASIFDDPKYRELTDEILRLSTEFGILTEYTAFLATEGTDLTHWESLVANCQMELDVKAVHTRSGVGAMNQSWNFNSQKAQQTLNHGNRYWNDKLDRVEVTGVQQLCDRAFFRRSNQWIDSRLVNESDSLEPDRTIVFGSEEHMDLLQRLIGEGRQALLSLQGEILLQYDGERILIKNDTQ